MKTTESKLKNLEASPVVPPVYERLLVQVGIIAFYVLLFFAISYFSKAIYSAENQTQSQNVGTLTE